MQRQTQITKIYTHLPLSEIKAEKDLCVIVNNKHNIHEHLATVTKTANSILSTIKNFFMSRQYHE